MFWILAFYLFCALLIGLYILVFRLITRPRFRDADGDITTEVGYEEDPTGRVIEHELRQASSLELEDPHVMNVTDHQSGPF